MPKLIPLTQGRFATVDDTDFEILSRYNWQIVVHPCTCYATAHIDHKYTLMHRFLMNAPTGETVDHLDGDGLNNCRANLRIATYSQNGVHRLRLQENKTSKYRGVCLASNKKVWQAQVVVDNKAISLGHFRTQRDAAIAYNEAALKYHGEFAIMNDIPDQPDPDDVAFPEAYKPKTPYRGVLTKKPNHGSQASIRIQGKSVYLGYFSTAEEAARAYDAFIIKHNLNRPLNFP